jgi:hypothetical protein
MTDRKIPRVCPCGKPAQPSRRACAACASRARRADPEKREKYNAWQRSRRAQLGPSGAVHKAPPVEVADGLELRAQTTQVNADGTLRTRYDKSALARTDEPAFEPVPAGHHVTKTTTRIDADGRVGMQYVTAKHDDAERERRLHAALRASLLEYVVPVDPVNPPEFIDSDTCGIIPVGDTHIGMLAHASETGEHSDLKIQERDLCAAMDRLVVGMPPSHTGTIILLGDNIHADDDQQVTPAHKHKLDVDGRSDKVARVAVNVFRRMIDRARTRFQQVNVEVVGGNHDPVTSLWLRLSLEFLYENEPRVFVNPSPASLRVWEFGRNLFGTCHGDGIKPENMMSTMAARYREEWGRARFAYGFQGHRHKKMQVGTIEKDGGIVEVFRTMTGKDAFAAKYGYESGQDLVGITYHKAYGEIERKTVGKLLARSEGAC